MVTEEDRVHRVDFLLREPDAEYREKSKVFLSSAQLADFRKCPLLYYKKRMGLIENVDCSVLNSAAHVLILEGVEKFEAEYEAQKNLVLTDTQFNLVMKLSAAVDVQPMAVELFSGGVPRGIVRTEYCGFMCQGRLDFFNPEKGLVELKICDDITRFEADVHRYGYVRQFAFYRSLVRQETSKEFPVHVIAVEKKEPFRCGVWLVHEQAMAIAQADNEASIERLKQCEFSDAWPTGYEDRRVLLYL